MAGSSLFEILDFTCQQIERREARRAASPNERAINAPASSSPAAFGTSTLRGSRNARKRVAFDIRRRERKARVSDNARTVAIEVERRRSIRRRVRAKCVKQLQCQREASTHEPKILDLHTLAENAARNIYNSFPLQALFIDHITIRARDHNVGVTSVDNLSINANELISNTSTTGNGTEALVEAMARVHVNGSSNQPSA